MSSAALSLHLPARKPPPAALGEIRGFKLRIQGLETQAIPGLAVVLGPHGGGEPKSTQEIPQQEIQEIQEIKMQEFMKSKKNKKLKCRNS